MTGASHNECEPARRTWPWLVRVPEVFEGVADDVLRRMGAVSTKRLGQDYYLVRRDSPDAVGSSEVGKFARWNLPVEHAWPCNPRKMEGFIEKGVQAVLRKFGSRQPQGIFVGQLNPTALDRYYKTLGSNLRGRALQLFPGTGVVTVEGQDPAKETLFCLVGKEGLYCGMETPRAANGLYPGGSKYIDQGSPDAISRAGAKIAEALHYLLLHRRPPEAGSHWLELGACPGGMTSELLARGYRVTAVDRSPLDGRLNGRADLEFSLADVGEFVPPPGTSYDALLSDLNGPARESLGHVIRLTPYLKAGGLVVFTLKLSRVEDVDAPCALFRETVEAATRGGLRLLAQTHLTYNRHEFTLFFEVARGA